MKLINKFWIGILILIALSPFGIIFSGYFNSGSAWGEWGVDEIKELLGYVPKGLEKLSTLWSAPMPDYTFKGWEEKPLGQISFAYILSAIIGVIICVSVVLILGKFLSKKK
jgi:hypothetical protein